jgi:hypothetical protein
MEPVRIRRNCISKRFFSSSYKLLCYAVNSRISQKWVLFVIVYCTTVEYISISCCVINQYLWYVILFSSLILSFQTKLYLHPKFYILIIKLLETADQYFEVLCGWKHGGSTRMLLWCTALTLAWRSSEIFLLKERLKVSFQMWGLLYFGPVCCASDYISACYRKLFVPPQENCFPWSFISL